MVEKCKPAQGHPDLKSPRCKGNGWDSDTTDKLK